MGHICVRGLADLSKWDGLIYGEKFGFVSDVLRESNMQVLLLAILLCCVQVSKLWKTKIQVFN